MNNKPFKDIFFNKDIEQTFALISSFKELEVFFEYFNMLDVKVRIKKNSETDKTDILFNFGLGLENELLFNDAKFLSNKFLNKHVSDNDVKYVKLLQDNIKSFVVKYAHTVCDSAMVSESDDYDFAILLIMSYLIYKQYVNDRKNLSEIYNLKDVFYTFNEVKTKQYDNYGLFVKDSHELNLSYLHNFIRCININDKHVNVGNVLKSFDVDGVSLTPIYDFMFARLTTYGLSSNVTVSCIESFIRLIKNVAHFVGKVRLDERIASIVHDYNMSFERARSLSTYDIV